MQSKTYFWHLAQQVSLHASVIPASFVLKRSAVCAFPPEEVIKSSHDGA